MRKQIESVADAVFFAEDGYSIVVLRLHIRGVCSVGFRVTD